jgi:hypothetical protein
VGHSVPTMMCCHTSAAPSAQHTTMLMPTCVPCTNIVPQTPEQGLITKRLYCMPRACHPDNNINAFKAVCQQVLVDCTNMQH